MKDSFEKGLTNGYQYVYKGYVCHISAVYVSGLTVYIYTYVFLLVCRKVIILEDNVHYVMLLQCVHVHATCKSCDPCIDDFSFRLNDRVRKRAMTGFERDKMMSSMSPQLDYKVSDPVLILLLLVTTTHRLSI